MKKHEIHVISHTHWDREWYLPFQQFRVRLVELIDNLVNIFKKDKKFRYFLLDGQSIVLEDYLEVKPYMRKRLKQLIEARKVYVGPWYVLPDEFLVSPESIIRNLLIGHEIANEFGNVLKTGYLPDSFGHISQMPQILKGFGIDNFVFMRGRGFGEKGLKSEFIWRGADNSEVFAMFLIKSYCHARQLPSEINEAVKKVNKLKSDLAPFATTKYILFMNGCDHQEAQPDLSYIISGVNERIKDAKLVHSNFPLFLGKIRKSCKNLSSYKGELRVFRSKEEQAWLLPGVFSSRVYLKQENFRCQNLLEKWVEPFSALSLIFGNEPEREMIKQSWKYLLQNHPHDSICGCSVDSVHRQMMIRYEWSSDLSEWVLSESANKLFGFIDTSFLKESEKAIIVFNTSGFAATGMVKTKVDLKNELGYKSGFCIVDEKGENVEYGIDDMMDTEVRFTSGPFVPRNFVKRLNISFLAKDVPAFGYRVFKMEFEKSGKKKVISDLSSHKNTFGNKYLKIDIAKNGTLAIEVKASGNKYKNCLLFEDRADVGDEYNYSHIINDKPITSGNSKAKIKKIRHDSGCIKYLIETSIGIPEYSDKNKRSPDINKHKIVSIVSLSSESKRIDVETFIDNKSRDHRLRVLFDSGARNAQYSEAEGHFDVVKREVKLKNYTDNTENPVPTHHLNNFIDVNNNKTGLMIATRGIHEYEVFENKERTIAITLLRCTGWLSKGDLLTRRGDAGPTMPAPDAQCMGKYRFNYSIIPHEGSWEKSVSYREAYLFAHEMRAFLTDRHKGEKAMPAHSFMKIYDSRVVLSAFKPAEQSNRLIVRFFNISNDEISARVHFYFPFKSIKPANLDETPAKDHELPVVINGINLDFKPKQVKTVNITI